MAEQLICNQQVDGSTPFTSSIFYGGIPERPKGADCKSVVTDFAGPNPASPTKEKTSPCDWFFSLARIACNPEQALAKLVHWSAFAARRSASLFARRRARKFSPSVNTQLPHRPCDWFFLWCGSWCEQQRGEANAVPHTA